MTTAVRTAPPQAAIEYEDKRKRTELDADFARLHAATVKRLDGVLRRFVADLRRGDMADAHAQSVFIAAATQVLQGAYEAGHGEGQRDYWQTFSASRRNPRQIAEPSDERTRRIMGWYAVASLAKMAREGAAAVQAARHNAALSETKTLADGGGDALDDWYGGLGQRVALQASISWVGLQDGYVDAGDLDPAGLPMSVYWILGPAVHCEDCLDLATRSPYDPPWGAYHGNPLTQSPGDGQTACGASCKCDLDYRPDWRRVNEAGVAASWRAWLGSSAGREAVGNIGTGAGFGPNEALLPPEVPERIGGPAQAANTASGMTDRQLDALDRFRDASAAWERVRGELPEAPDLFAEAGAPDVKFETALELPAWDRLTPEQQRAVTEMLAAVWDWVDTLGEGEEDAEQFTEALDTIRLYGHPPGYSQNRMRNGQWAPGDGGEHAHGGSGGGGGRQGEHEAARGGGVIHGAGAGEVHEAHVGGGGGGHSGGHSRPPEGYEVAREAGQWHPRAVDLHGTLHAIPGEHGYDSYKAASQRAWEIHNEKGRVTVEEERSGTRAQLERFAGRSFTDEEIVGLAGAGPGSRIVLEPASFIATHAPDGTLTRVQVQRDDESGKRLIFNYMEERPGQPLTAPRDPEMLLRQATAAQKLGIETIAAKAHSTPLRDSETLTRMGYNAPLDAHLLTELRGMGRVPRSLSPYPPNWPKMHYVSDLMKSAEGRAWFFARPHTGTMYFDTRHSSYSMKQLRAYLRHHGRDQAEGGGTP